VNIYRNNDEICIKTVVVIPWPLEWFGTLLAIAIVAIRRCSFFCFLRSRAIVVVAAVELLYHLRRRQHEHQTPFSLLPARLHELRNLAQIQLRAAIQLAFPSFHTRTSPSANFAGFARRLAEDFGVDGIERSSGGFA